MHFNQQMEEGDLQSVRLAVSPCFLLAHSPIYQFTYSPAPSHPKALPLAATDGTGNIDWIDELLSQSPEGSSYLCNVEDVDGGHPSLSALISITRRLFMSPQP
jgi:hypothetical protein